MKFEQANVPNQTTYQSQKEYFAFCCVPFGAIEAAKADPQAETMPMPGWVQKELMDLSVGQKQPDYSAVFEEAPAVEAPPGSVAHEAQL